MPKRETILRNDGPTYRADEYLYSVVWSDDDNAFIGRVVEFPSLAAHGKTQAAALLEITSVVEHVLTDLDDGGDLVPVPLGKKEYSGKLNLRMPSHLHRQLTI